MPRQEIGQGLGEGEGATLEVCDSWSWLPGNGSKNNDRVQQHRLLLSVLIITGYSPTTTTISSPTTRTTLVSYPFSLSLQSLISSLLFHYYFTAQRLLPISHATADIANHPSKYHTASTTPLQSSRTAIADRPEYRP